MTLVLCVLLWARPGADDGLFDYEDQVLPLLADHGGGVLQRARTDGREGRPLEIQLLELPSADALERFMTDHRRTALGAVRDRAVARTEVVEVNLLPSG